MTVMTLHDFYKSLTEQLGCVCIKDRGFAKFYKIPDHVGQGWLRIIELPGYASVIIGDFTLDKDYEAVTRTEEVFIEVGIFETGTSKKKRMRAYMNNSRTASLSCSAHKPVRLVKVIITDHEYFSILTAQTGISYNDMPELVFHINQFRDLHFAALTELYIKSKVDEVLTTLVSLCGEQSSLPVRLTEKDRKSLGRVTEYIKKNPASYPSIQELSRIAGISVTRFQMAFKMFYGITVYSYQKQVRLRSALTLLHNRDTSIQDVALALGYRNAGHFAGLFKKEYKMTPMQYRKLSLKR